MTGATRDTISLRGAGVVTINQPGKGHRFTLDSILLADFCRIKPKDSVLEPGAGTGVVSLLLARKFPRSLFYAVEVQDDLQSLCEENRRSNDLKNVTCVHRDLRRLDRSFNPAGFDVIVANPPYTREGTGRTSPLAGRRISRQDLLGSIESWLDLQKLLKHGGRYNLIFPASRAAEILAFMKGRRIEPKRLRFIHPKSPGPASLVLLEAAKSAGPGLVVHPPLVVHGPDGSYTDEMRDIYEMN